jgi:hypothetical protein
MENNHEKLLGKQSIRKQKRKLEDNIKMDRRETDLGGARWMGLTQYCECDGFWDLCH